MALAAALATLAVYLGGVLLTVRGSAGRRLTTSWWMRRRRRQLQCSLRGAAYDFGFDIAPSRR